MATQIERVSNKKGRELRRKIALPTKAQSECTTVRRTKSKTMAMIRKGALFKSIVVMKRRFDSRDGDGVYVYA